MANIKYRYRIKRYLNSIPNIEVSEKVEVPEKIFYGNAVILCNAHNTTFKPEERYTFASAVPNGKKQTYDVTILTGNNAGNVYKNVPDYGGNLHFNEYKGDTYSGVNFSREQEKKDNIAKDTEISVKEVEQIVKQQNEKAVKKARDLMNQIYNRPEY